MGTALQFRTMTIEDAMSIKRQASQRVQLGLEAVMTPEIAEDLIERGESAAVLRDGVPIACFGLRQTYPPVQGTAWTILADGIGSAHLAVTRYAAMRIAASPLRRIEAIVRAGVNVDQVLDLYPDLDPYALLQAVLAVRTPDTVLARLVGLTPVALLRRFGDASEDHILFERIR